MKRVLLFAPLVGIVATSLAMSDGRAQEERVQVIVLVVDGLDPNEVTEVKAPFIASLKEQGTWYEQARSVVVSDTLPNHVAMMTGAYPERSGIPMNDWWARHPAHTPGSEMEEPRLLRASTLFTAVQRQCPELRTAAILSKTYLHGIFSGDHTGDGEIDADFLWEPSPVIPGSDHAPDTATTESVLDELPNEPDLLFVSLGDVDRAGHVDESGPSGEPAFRDAAIQNTDSQVERIVNALKDAGRWESTVLFLVSDHSMDWSRPDDYISLTSAFNEDPALEGTFIAVQNGGVDSIYMRPKAGKKQQRLALMMKIARKVEGVRKVYYRRPNKFDRNGPVLLRSWHNRIRPIGDLFALAERGYRFSDPSRQSNPIPGNHGHPPTRHGVALITGGAPIVKVQTIKASDKKAINLLNDTTKLTEQSETPDIGVTAAWLLGLREPERKQFQGRVLRESFTGRPAVACT